MGKKSGTPPSTAVPPNNKVFFSTLDWAQESTTPEYNYARCTIVYSRVVFPIRRVRDIVQSELEWLACLLENNYYIIVEELHYYLLLH